MTRKAHKARGKAKRLKDGAELAQWVHVTYGLRKDGTIGRAEAGVPVLTDIEFSVDGTQQDCWHWSDGSVSGARGKRWEE
mgnify:CR=1 FL=1